MSTKDLYQPRGRYFEEFQIGETVVSASRTITETDVVSFAAASGDWTRIHTDVEYAKQTMFGQRVAHGMLILSIAIGLVARLRLIEGTVLAFRELSWKFSRPVFIGDTIHVVAEVTELKPLPRLKGGAVILKVAVHNQEDQAVMRGTWNVLMETKPAE